jgi:transcriptional regulator with XRE-family HTH domain
MNRLRQAREERGLSQRVLAQRADISQSQLSAAERNQLILWPKARRELSRILGMPEAELFPKKTVGPRD